MEKPIEYKVEDIFPPEIMEAQGCKQGDNLKIEWGDQGSIIITKLESPSKAP